MSKQTQYRLSLFGGFQLRDSENKLIDPGPRKAKALLAWLAVHPDAEHPREKLAAIFWPDKEEESARHSLRQVLGSLRKALTPGAAEASPLQSGKGWVRLDSALIKIDVLEFESAINDGGIKASAKAGKLYKGEFLAGCNPRADLFDDWVMDYRHHYRERATAAMCRSLSMLIDRGLFKQAVPLAMQLINIDPLRESAYRGLMMAHQGLGNHALALRWYRRCESVLLREVDVLPCLETRALHAQLLSAWDKAQADTSFKNSAKSVKKHVQELTSVGNQRVLYQAGAAMEAIVDRIGGQSILIRGGIEEERAVCLQAISALAKPQGFKIYHGQITAALEDTRNAARSELSTHISACLTVGSSMASDHSPATVLSDSMLPDSALPDSTCRNLRTDDNLEACINSIKVASKTAPLLLILDNIHVAGSQILQLLARLIFTAGQSSILLVMTTHFGDHALDPVWRGAMLNAPLTTIDLSTTA